MTTVLLWQIRQSSKKVSLCHVYDSSKHSCKRKAVLSMWKRKREGERESVGKCSWCAFVQLNNCALITGWKVPLRTLFFPLYILGNVITSIVACLGTQCESTAKEEFSICTCTAYNNNPRSHEMHLSKLDVILTLFCWRGCLNGCPVGKNWSLSKATGYSWHDMKIEQSHKLRVDCERRGKLWIIFRLVKLAIAALFSSC